MQPRQCVAALNALGSDPGSQRLQLSVALLLLSVTV